MRLKTKLYLTSGIVALGVIAVGSFGLYSSRQSLEKTRERDSEIAGFALSFRDEVLALSKITGGDVGSGTKALGDSRARTRTHFDRLRETPQIDPKWIDQFSNLY